MLAARWLAENGLCHARNLDDVSGNGRTVAEDEL